MVKLERRQISRINTKIHFSSKENEIDYLGVGRAIEAGMSRFAFMSVLTNRCPNFKRKISQDEIKIFFHLFQKVQSSERKRIISHFLKFWNLEILNAHPS